MLNVNNHNFTEGCQITPTYWEKRGNSTVKLTQLRTTLTASVIRWQHHDVTKNSYWGMFVLCLWGCEKLKSPLKEEVNIFNCFLAQEMQTQKMDCTVLLSNAYFSLYYNITHKADLSLPIDKSSSFESVYEYLILCLWGLEKTSRRGKSLESHQ